jgi:polysaccharide deacetylase 2 family uncharacterized protein YibQ
VPDRRRRLIRPGSIVSFFLTCVLGVLVYVIILQLQNPELQSPQEPSVTFGNPVVNSNADFPERIEQVTAALAALPLPLPTPTTVPQGAGALRWTHRRYDITLPKPRDAGNIEQLFEPLRHAAAGVTVQATAEPDGAKVQIGVDGLLTHTLILHWLGHPPRAAIIVDNLGSDLLLARTLADVKAPLTFAVRPAQPFSKEVAELASLLGREVLLQLPQEPARAGETTTPQARDRSAVERRLSENLAGVPHAVGVTSGPGAPLARDAEQAQWILSATKENNLFLVDTSGERADTCEAAAAVPVTCVPSNVRLADGSDEENLHKQLDEVLQTARIRGDVIAVGGASPALAAALRSAIPAFAAAGVDLVPASTVVADRSLASH